MQKRRLSSFDVKILVEELRRRLVNGIISNVYQSNALFILKVHTQEGRSDLILEPPYRFNITKYEYEKPRMPTNFCRALRKRLRQGRIEEIRQVNDDRILLIKVRKGSNTRYLVLELIREGNLLLLDSNMKIELVLKSMKLRDRDILPGVTYTPPPKSFLDILVTPLEEILQELKKGRGDLIRNMVVRLGIPSEIAEEICYRTGLNKNKPISEVTLEDLHIIRDTYEKLLKEALEEGKGYIITKEDRYVCVSPIYLHYMIERGYEITEYANFNEAVDEYFVKGILLSKERERLREIEKERKKIVNEIEECKRRLEEYNRLAKEYREMANIIFTRLNVVNYILEKVRELKRVYKEWKIVEQTLRKDSYLSGYVAQIMPTEGKILISINGRSIPLEIKMSAQENAGRFYELSKEYERKAKRIMSILNEKKKELEKVSKTIAEGIIKERLKVRRKTRWFEKFHWFITSDGHIVIGGRDFKQNEMIVRKYLSDNDIFMHADIHGAPAVVLKVNDKEELDENIIMEVAQFAAAYSRAWKLGMSAIDVYWVRGSQVSKSPPHGEYLPKGAFMVRGKRNYIKGVPLVLDIGLCPDDEALIIAGPPSAIRSRCQLWVEIVPGNREKTEIAKFILNFFKENIKDEKLKERLNDVTLDHVIRLIPGPSIIVKTGTKVKS